MIDLDALVSLQAIDAHGSVVAAAEALAFTPSAVSQQIKRLERQTGVALLERVGRGVILTSSGRELVEGGRRLLAELETIEAGLHRRSGAVAGRFRLAAFSTALRGLVGPALPGLLGAHPNLEVAVSEIEPWDTIELVASGRCDLGVVHRWGDVALGLPEQLEAVHLADDVADVLVARTHRLAGRSRISPKDLIEETWIATPVGTICRQWLHRMYDGTGHNPRVAHHSSEFETHLTLVQAGLGIALVPRLGRGALPAGVVAIAVHRPVPSREITAVYRSTMRDSPAVAAVVGALVAQGATRPSRAIPRRMSAGPASRVGVRNTQQADA